VTALALSTGTRAESFLSSASSSITRTVVARGTGAAPSIDPARTPASREAFVRHRLSLAGAYPQEFVVLLGARVVFHSPHREEAVARYRALSGEAGEAELPALVEPGKRGLRPDAVVRGRSGSSTTR
jgi:hypothetical protein